MVLYYSSWKDFTDTVRTTGSYIVFYKGVPINHFTHVPGPVSHSSAEIEYNAECTSGLDLEHFRVLNNDMINKDTDMVLENAPLILYSIGNQLCLCTRMVRTPITSKTFPE